MTLSIEDANDLSALDAKVLREIHTDGWQITGVLDREPDNDAGFAYSIGFFHSMPTMAPRRAPDTRLSAITAEPAPGATETAMP